MDDAAGQLAFFQKLQQVTNRIHATANVGEIMLDLGLDFCDLLDCHRFTLYALAPDKEHIVSRVKTGLATFRDLRLPLGPSSITGFVAQTRQPLRIADVYDEAELRRLSPELQFQRGVDQRTGYRTREMLVAPLQDKAGELLGMVQFINHRGGGPFPLRAMDAVRQLGETLSVALGQRLRPQRMRGKYDALVQEAVLTQPELEQAGRRARAGHRHRRGTGRRTAGAPRRHRGGAGELLQAALRAQTTTLHSILHHLNTPETKIWTAEDPVEITQKGLRQVQVNRKA